MVSRPRPRPRGGGLSEVCPLNEPPYYVYTGPGALPGLPATIQGVPFLPLVDAEPPSAAKGLLLALPWPGEPPDLPLYALTLPALLAHPTALQAFSDAAEPSTILAALLCLLGEPVPRRPEPMTTLIQRLKALAPKVAVVGPYLGTLSRLLARGGIRSAPLTDLAAPLVACRPLPELLPYLPPERPWVSLWPIGAEVPPTHRGAQLVYGHEEASLLAAFQHVILLPDSPRRLLGLLRHIARGRRAR